MTPEQDERLEKGFRALEQTRVSADRLERLRSLRDRLTSASVVTIAVTFVDSERWDTRFAFDAEVAVVLPSLDAEIARCGPAVERNSAALGALLEAIGSADDGG